MILQRTVLLVAVACLCMLACQKDRCVCCPFKPSINGNFTGTYRYVQIEGGVDTAIDSTQNIRLRFRADQYALSIGDLPDSLGVFCDIIGTYELGAGLYMSVADVNYTRGVCPPHYGFGGWFSLDQTTDTLRMLNDQTDSTGTRQVRKLALLLAS